MLIYSIVMGILYPLGVPVLYFILLFRKRHLLFPHNRGVGMTVEYDDDTHTTQLVVDTHVYGEEEVKDAVSSLVAEHGMRAPTVKEVGRDEVARPVVKRSALSTVGHFMRRIGTSPALSRNKVRRGVAVDALVSGRILVCCLSHWVRSGC